MIKFATALYEVSKAMETNSKAFLHRVSRLSEEEVKAIREKPSYYDLINWDEREDRDEISDSGVVAWVELPGVIEIPFPYPLNNPPTDEQLREMFLKEDEERFIDWAQTPAHLSGYPYWPAIRQELAEWMERPCLLDLVITHEK